MTQPARSDPPPTIIKQTSNKGEKVKCTDGKIRKIAEKITNPTTNETSFKFEHHKGSNAVFAKIWYGIKDLVSPQSTHEEVFVPSTAPLRFRGIEYSTQKANNKGVATLSPLGLTGKPLEIDFNKAEFYKYGNCVVVCKGEPSYQTFTIGSETLNSIKPAGFALSYKAEETDNISRSAAIKKALPKIYEEHNIANFSIFDFETKEEGQQFLNSFLPETKDVNFTLPAGRPASSVDSYWPPERDQQERFYPNGDVPEHRYKMEILTTGWGGSPQGKALKSISIKLGEFANFFGADGEISTTTVFYHPKALTPRNPNLTPHQDMNPIQHLIFFGVKHPGGKSYQTAIIPKGELTSISSFPNSTRYFGDEDTIDKDTVSAKWKFTLENGDCCCFDNEEMVHTIQDMETDCERAVAITTIL